MTDLERYLHAATRENTRQSYASALKHFEQDWGGHLPAHAEGIARYLAAYAEQLAISTLRQRLAALARWHADHGFVDPTRAPIVRNALRGIQALHPAVEKQAVPLQLTELGTVVDWLESASTSVAQRYDPARARRHLRDRALILLGFWRGFRGDELTRLRIEYLEIRPGEGLSAFLPRSKTDRGNEGQTYKVPALSRWCPVAATQAWVASSGRQEGPLFPKINRWGAMSETAMHVDSIVPVLRRAFAQAGLIKPGQYSGHSLRRGFASWANANGWDVKSLMEYVGWRNVHSAMRYIDLGSHFAQASMEHSVVQHASAALPAPATTSVVPEPRMVDLIVRFALTSYANSVRKRSKARRLIEETCLARHRAQREDADGYRFHIRIADNADLEEVVATVLDDMYRIADNHECYLEVGVSERDGPRRWE
jgi:integrase